MCNDNCQGPDWVDGAMVALFNNTALLLIVLAMHLHLHTVSIIILHGCSFKIHVGSYFVGGLINSIETVFNDA